MKILLIIISLFSIASLYAGTCSSISRSNSTSLSVLTATKYNTDHNTAYSAINAFDGGCVTSGTLESDSLNTSQFAPLLKGIKEGCLVTRQSASTISISRCLASVNGNFVNKTTNTTASFGCSGCSAEAPSTTYYVYIQSGSSGSTITPLILTTAPNEDGYDSSGNKVLAIFWNDSSSDIDRYSVDQWMVNRFVPTNTYYFSYTPTIVGLGVATPSLTFSREGRFIRIRGFILSGTSTGVNATVSLPTGLRIDAGSGQLSGVVDSAISATTNISIVANGSTHVMEFVSAGSTLVGTSVAGAGDVVAIDALIPIIGWNP